MHESGENRKSSFLLGRHQAVLDFMQKLHCFDIGKCIKVELSSCELVERLYSVD